MRKDDLIYIQHILDAIDLIEDYTRGIGKKGFLSSRMIQDGSEEEKLKLLGRQQKESQMK